MPGSPPSSVTDPDTMPPSSTRSSSATPVDRATAAEASTSAMGRGALPVRTAAAGPAARCSSSTSEFHAPHVGHRPAHCGACPSHD